jgi:hypothetical protein
MLLQDSDLADQTCSGSTGVIAFERTSARPVSDSELYSKMPLTTRAHAASGREVGNFADEDCAANRLWPLPRNEMVGEKL